MSSAFSADAFFASQAPPQHLESTLSEVERFIEWQAANGRKVVLVTELLKSGGMQSGGTTVPLEQNVVRFIDNFSAGTRGSASAEHFLRSGEYAVIFMHRQHSLQPFSRHYSHSTHSFLDLMDVKEESLKQSVPKTNAQKALFPLLSGVSSPSRPSTPINGDSIHLNALATSHASKKQPQLTLNEPHLSAMVSLLKAYKLVHELHLLHTLTFVTVQEYLFLLRGISKIMARHLGRKAMFYLAAAVSDFFIPQQKMAEHKIQSGKGSLSIEMDQVPKVLRPLVEEWGSQSYIISFKLETEDHLLIPKARQALDRYGHQLVIANNLQRRKHEVVFIAQNGQEEWIRLNDAQLQNGTEIEEIIVERLVEAHHQWVASEHKM